MASEKTLTAILSGKGNLKKTLSGIADKAEDSAKALSEAASSAKAASKAFENADDKGDRLQDTLSGIVDNASVASESLDIAEDSAEEAGNAFWTASGFVRENTQALEKNTAVASAAASAQKALASATDEAGDAASESAVEYAGYNTVLASSVPSSVFGGFGTADVDTEKKAKLSIIPFLSGKSDSESKLRGFADTLKNALSIGDGEVDVRYPVREAKALASQLESIGEANPKVKVEIENADSFKALVKSLKSLENASIDELDLGGRDASIGGLFDQLLDSPPDAQLTERFDEIDTSDFERRLSVPVSFDVDRSPLRGFSNPLTGLSAPTIGSDDVDRDVDLPGRIPRFNVGGVLPDLRGVVRTGGKAAEVLGSVGESLTLITGTSRNFKGLSKLVGIFTSLGSSGGAVAGALGGIAGIGVSIAALIDLLAALGGFVTAFVGLGGIVASVIGVGLFKKGEQIAKQSKDIENAWQGIAEYAKSFQDDVRRALQPIFELPTGQFLEGFIGGGIGILGDWSTMTNRLFPDVDSMFSRLGKTWDVEQPKFFAALEENIRTFLPMIEGFLNWFIKAAPDGISFMTKMGKKLLPDMVDMFSSMWGAIKPLLPAGAAAAEIIMDLVTLFFEILTPITEILGFGLTPTLQGLAWGLGLVTDAVKWLSDGLSGAASFFNRWFGALWNALSNFKVGRFVKLVLNMQYTMFEGLANAFISGLEFFAEMALMAIDQLVPGDLGKLPGIPDNLNVELGEVSVDNWKADLNPKKKGKQTAPGKGPGGRHRKTGPYEKETHYHYHDEGGSKGEYGAEWRRHVRRANEQARRRERLRNSSLSG